MIVRFVGWALLGLFAAWWLLSLLGQSKTRHIARVRAFDLFHLIPSCRFFAPRPSCRDYHLEYRLRGPSGLECRWRRIVLAGERSWISVLWHPDKRTRKALSTIVRQLSRYLSRWGDQSTRQSLPYLRLLLFVENNISAQTGEALQFRILSSADYAQDCRVRLTFKSDWHSMRKGTHDL